MAAALLFASATSALGATPVVGALTQLAGLAGCLSSNGESVFGAGTCAVISGGGEPVEPESVVVSPEGNSVYSGDYRGGTIEVYARASNGALTQLPGAQGCLGPTATATCTAVRGMSGSVGDGRDIVLSTDGRFAYAAVQGNETAEEPGAVISFARDPATGALTQLAGDAGCITSSGNSKQGAGTCAKDETLARPMGVSLSPDGRFLYVTDYLYGEEEGKNPFRIHVYARNVSTGALTAIQCLAQEPLPAGCTKGRVLGDSQSLAITPNGLHAYSGDYEHGISVFDRNPETGLLTQKAGTAGCITDLGKDNEGNETCTKGRVLSGAYPLTVAPNGETLYVPSYRDNGIAVFHINADGTLTQLAGAAGCITATGKDNEGKETCATGRDLIQPYGGQISPDGATFYTTSDTKPESGAGGVAAFAVEPATGALSQLPGTEGCVTTNGTSNGKTSNPEATVGQCATGAALAYAYELAVSPDGTSLYVAADDTGELAVSGGGIAVFQRQVRPVCHAAAASTAYGMPVALTLSCASPDGEPVTVAATSPPAHGTLAGLNASTGAVTYTPTAGFSGTDSFTFAASDGTNVSAPATATITVGAPPPPPVTRTTLTLIGKPRVGAGGVRITVSCGAAAGARCQGVASLTSSEHLRDGRVKALSARKRGRRHTHVRTRVVTVGHRTFKISAGARASILVPLDATGRRLLARFGRLPATLILSLTNGASGKLAPVATRKVVLHKGRRRGRHRHKRRTHHG